MTTADIRQSVKDTINGKVMAGPDDDPFEQPMTFNEAARAAECFMEELGVLGHFSLKVEYEHYSTGARELVWRFYCWPAVGSGETINVKSQDCAAGLADFRAKLVRYSAPCSMPDIAAVGCPKLPETERADA